MASLSALSLLASALASALALLPTCFRASRTAEVTPSTNPTRAPSPAPTHLPSTVASALALAPPSRQAVEPWPTGCPGPDHPDGSGGGDGAASAAASRAPPFGLKRRPLSTAGTASSAARRADARSTPALAAMASMLSVGKNCRTASRISPAMTEAHLRCPFASEPTPLPPATKLRRQCRWKVAGAGVAGYPAQTRIYEPQVPRAARPGPPEPAIVQPAEHRLANMGWALG